MCFLQTKITLAACKERSPWKLIFNQFQIQNGLWQKILPWRLDLKCQKWSFRMPTHLSLSNSLNKRFNTFWGFGSSRLKDLSTQTCNHKQVIDVSHFIHSSRGWDSALGSRMNIGNINLLWRKYSHHFPRCKYCMPTNKNWSQCGRFNVPKSI